MAGPPPRVAVVIVNYRTPDLALRSVAALDGERAALPDLRVVLVDGGSGDGSAEALAAGLDRPELRGWTELMALPINGGFGWANNQAMLSLLQSDRPPDHIHLLNPDAEIVPGAVARLAAGLDAAPRCGAIGSLLLKPDGSPSGSAFRFPTVAREFIVGLRVGRVARLLRIAPVLQTEPGEAEWVTGASVMIRAAALRETGLFDDGFFLYFEEVELMWRLRRAGWSIRYDPESRAVHVGGAATGLNDHVGARIAPRLPPYWFRSRRRFFALTGGPGRAIAANLAWLVGHAGFTILHALGFGRDQTVTRAQGRDLLRHGLWPGSADRRAAAIRWDDPPGRPPRWMTETRDAG